MIMSFIIINKLDVYHEWGDLAIVPYRGFGGDRGLRGER